MLGSKPSKKWQKWKTDLGPWKHERGLDRRNPLTLPYRLKALQHLLGRPKHQCLLEALLAIDRLMDALKHYYLLDTLLVAPRHIHTLQPTIPTLALLLLSLIIATKDHVTPKESKLRQAILLRLALAFENGGTGRRTSNESSKETPIRIGQGLKRSLRL
jgi:hypothetical protein